MVLGHRPQVEMSWEGPERLGVPNRGGHRWDLAC